MPSTLTCPPRHASVAADRVLHTRTAQSQRSTRTDSMTLSIVPSSHDRHCTKVPPPTEHIAQTDPVGKDPSMPRRSRSLAVTLLVAAVIGLASCGASVDEVKDAAGNPESTTSPAADRGANSTAPDDRPTTTRADRSGSTDGDAGPYVQAMTDSMLDDDDVPITEEQARCFAGKSIDIIGVDRLKKKGIEPADLRDDSALDLSDVGLSMDDGNEIYDAFEDCDIDLRGLMMESMSEDEEVSAEAQACLDQVLTDDNLRKLMVITIVKGDDATETDPDLKEVMGGLMGCMFMSMGSEGSTP